MTTTNLNPAEGGRIWTLNSSTPKRTLSQNLRQVRETLTVITVITVIMLGPMVVICAATGVAEAHVYSTSKDEIGLTFTPLNPGSAVDKIKAWVPTALELDKATVKEVHLNGTGEGTEGTVTLTNGKPIPFTLHNQADHTFTVTKD